ncbi:UbiA prenyltransferase family-domain-containing protein [Mycena rosella]|uniref:UbiA prenyltransferase family-domain-containing protein n=1 Tax=Mycena rosella TaxID=1033263 RepID=A0AAD7D9U6_MYCRO|nr:UbiA prenyltransferase family-domain-containing protein [Mycena rosella]
MTTAINPELHRGDGEHIHGLTQIRNAIYHEFRVFWDFTWRDWSASLIPGMMYTTAALRSLTPTPSTSQIASSLACSFCYFLLYIYSFDIANQINGVAEDRINKPDRPLSSGRVSLQGAYIRWYTTTAAHLLVSAALGVLPWGMLWVAITVYTSFCGGDKHWFTKNLVFMSVGSLCLLHASWALVTPLTAREWRWALTLSGVFGVVANVQDMRDVDGDRVAGRRTLPILLGDLNFRRVMVIVIAATPFFCWHLEFFKISHLIVGYCAVGLAISVLYMAFRVYRGLDKTYDHQTYMILTYIYCGCIALPMLFP